MIWIPIILNLLIVAPFLWAVINPGNGPDGAMEASFMFVVAVVGTLIVWGGYGAFHLFILFLSMWQG